MPVGGVERIIYGVADMPASLQFYDDFGLKAIKRTESETIYQLDEGSKVVLRHIDDPSLPAPHYAGSGVRQTFYGVDTAEELDIYAERIGVDRDVKRGKDGISIEFLSDCG